MKGLYVVTIDIDSQYYVGVKNKINAQINAFKQFNYDIDLISRKDILKVNNIEELFNEKNYRLNNYEFAYIRYVPGNFTLFSIIKEISKEVKKIFLEIPTYPYMTEIDNNLDKLKLLIKDICITKQLNKYISYITTTNSIKSIWGVKTIQIRNGIDIDKLPLVKRKKINGEFNMIGLANLNKWHGYDRVIKAIYNYKKQGKNVNINFYIVGDGKEKANLERLVKEYNLNDNVHFEGVLSGKALDNLMDNMDIGISSLALHRAGGGHDPIKTKEFIGRGMPVMLGYEDKLVDMSLEYVLKISEDEKDIDLSKIYEMFLNIKSSKEEIRKYAADNLSWKKQINKVINAVNNKEIYD